MPVSLLHISSVSGLLASIRNAVELSRIHGLSQITSYSVAKHSAVKPESPIVLLATAVIPNYAISKY
jgi:hypothetical protein